MRWSWISIRNVGTRGERLGLLLSDTEGRHHGKECADRKIYGREPFEKIEYRHTLSADFSVKAFACKMV